MRKELFLITLLMIENILNDTVFHIDENSEEGTHLVFLKEDGEFKIKIQGNPTTGFMWSIVEESIANNSSILQFLDDSVTGKFERPKQNDNEERMVGVPGFYYFSFKPVSLGEANLIFQYKRSWEPEAIQTYRAKIIVLEENDL